MKPSTSLNKLFLSNPW